MHNMIVLCFLSINEWLFSHVISCRSLEGYPISALRKNQKKKKM
jgi:hypothetical protein